MIYRIIKDRLCSNNNHNFNSNSFNRR